MKRICKKCNESKQIEEFNKNPKSREGHVWLCKSCQKERRRLYPSKKISGVYKLSSKLIPEKFYIGSSTNLIARRNDHKRTHRNPNIYSHVKKYGIHDLEFSILKICDVNSLIIWEQYYISELNPCFNVNRFATHADNTGIEAKRQAFKDIAKEYYTNNKLSKENIFSVNLVVIDHLVRDLCDKEIFPETKIPISV